MKIAPLGTVLPTKKDFEINDLFFENHQKESAKIADHLLKDTQKRNINGEIRYYVGENKYAIVGRNLKILWFEVRKDGDYSIRQ